MESNNRKIMVIENNKRNLELLISFINKINYIAVGVSDLNEIENTLDNEDNIEVALIDAQGFDSTLWSKCELLTKKSIPFILISAIKSHEAVQAGFNYGARQVLHKPLVMSDIAVLISNILKEPHAI